MAEPKDPFLIALNQINGDLVLDVATGSGGFAEILASNLRSYARIVGIDLSMRMMAGAVGKVTDQRTGFVQVHAGRLAFVGAAFDTVSLSASLHHLADPSLILAEIDRVLKPGGHLIVAEMHSGARTEAQRTSVLIHQWAAAIDRALGLPHYPTLERQRILDLVAPLALCRVAVYDRAGFDSDPMDEARIRELGGAVDRCLAKVRDQPCYVEFRSQATALCQRLQDTGAQDEPRVAIIGRKPASAQSPLL